MIKSKLLLAPDASNAAHISPGYTIEQQDGVYLVLDPLGGFVMGTMSYTRAVSEWKDFCTKQNGPEADDDPIPMAA
jgi:hypothetical protein